MLFCSDNYTCSAMNQLVDSLTQVSHLATVLSGALYVPWEILFFKKKFCFNQKIHSENVDLIKRISKENTKVLYNFIFILISIDTNCITCRELWTLDHWGPCEDYQNVSACPGKVYYRGHTTPGSPSGWHDSPGHALGLTK